MSVDPREVFRFAETYRMGALILEQKIPLCVPPMVVCSAFSVELYLKCLILAESGEFKNIHSLDELFSKVGPDSQKKIRAYYEPHRARLDAMYAIVRNAMNVPTTPNTDFDTCLKLSAEAFVKFRYSYEGPMGPFEGWMADPIREAEFSNSILIGPTFSIFRHWRQGSQFREEMQWRILYSSEMADGGLNSARRY